MTRRFLAHACWLIVVVSISSVTGAEEFPSWAPPSLDKVAETLAGLSFDQFTGEVSEVLLLFSPQAITWYGLATRFGVRNDRLHSSGTGSDDPFACLSTIVLDAIERFDRETLTFDQRISYQVVWEVFDSILAEGQTASLFWSSVNPTLDSAMFRLERFFSDALPRTGPEDLDAFIVQLWQVENLIDEWIDDIEQSVASGIYLPRVNGMTRMRDVLRTYQYKWSIRNHPYYKLGTQMLVDGLDLSDSFRESYLERLEEVVVQSVIPAFRRLYEIVDALVADAPLEIDWATHPAWPSYYRNELRVVLGTDLTPEAIHDLANAEIERLGAEIRALSDQPDGAAQSLFSILSDLWEANCSSDIDTNAEILADSYALFESTRERADSLFAWLPDAELEIRFSDRANPYYDPPPFDGSEDAAFLLPNDFSYQAYRIPTVVSHETIPGHYLQVSTARQEDIPLIQQLNGWLGYAEGWATYAEQLVVERGWRDNDLCGYLGYLEGQLLMAVMTAIETGLAALDWSLSDVADFMETISEQQREQLKPVLANVSYNPTSSTVYFVGRMMFLEQRQRAMVRLGDDFELLDFHQAVLEHGNVPLWLLETLIDNYIQQTSRQWLLP